MQDRLAGGSINDRDVFAAPRMQTQSQSGMKRSLSTKLLPGGNNGGGAGGPLSSKPSNALPSARRQLLPSSSKSVKEGLWKAHSATGAARTLPHPTPSYAPGSAPQQQPEVDKGCHQAAAESARTAPSVSTLASDSMKRSASVAGLRSPPPFLKRPAVFGQRQEEDDGSQHGGRPAKRAYIASSGPFQSSLASSTASSTASRQKPTLKPRRSLAFPPPPALSASLSSSSNGNGGTLPPARRASLAPPPSQLPSSGSLLSLSPSKFGLTVPREFTFTSSTSSTSASDSLKPSLPPLRHGSAPIVNKVPPRTLLAPSPIRTDEHVPKPVLPMPPSRTIQANLSSYVSRPPFSQKDAPGRSDRPAQIAGSPGQARQLEMKSHPTGKDAKAFFSPIKEEISGKPRKSISPAQKQDMLRSDLMWRTLEKVSASPTAGQGAQRVATYSSSPTKVSLSSLIGPDSAQSASAPRAVEDQLSRGSRSVHHPVDLQPRAIASQEMLPSSPLKRSRSPSSEQHQGASQPAAASHKRRVFSGMRRSASISSMPRSMSTRSITRRVASASAHGQGQGTSSGTHQPATVRAGISVPTSQPREEDMETEVLLDPNDPFVPPVSPETSSAASSSSKTASPECSAEESTSLGDFTTIDMDTSIMSASGQESLLNLNSLLSKMSLPTRRSSGMFKRTKNFAGTVHLLDERAEMEEERLTGPPTAKLGHGTKRVPGYLASTASSAAKTSSGPEEQFAGGLKRSTGPVALGRPTIEAPGVRRSSTGLPAPRRGSLLPLASSSNAAQTALRTSNSLVGGPLPTAAAKADVLVEGTGGDAVMPAAQPTALAIRADRLLWNVVAFVDVKTAEGDEAGGVFIDILRSLGARILTRPTASVTHIIFKGGKPATLHRYRAYEQSSRPFLVGVGWIVSCREKNERVSEEPFLINPDTVDGVLLGSANAMAAKKNRRTSLEPKMLLAVPQPQYSELMRGAYPWRADNGGLQALPNMSLVLRGIRTVPTSSIEPDVDPCNLLREASAFSV